MAAVTAWATNEEMSAVEVAVAASLVMDETMGT